MQVATVPEKIETWQMVQPTVKDRETGEVKPGKMEQGTNLHSGATAGT
jgi:6-hydroxycyclohex-1-ene-1-carbonyl-CoA dehydrogenase